jgi:hypothetical protein
MPIDALFTVPTEDRVGCRIEDLREEGAEFTPRDGALDLRMNSVGTLLPIKRENRVTLFPVDVGELFFNRVAGRIESERRVTGHMGRNIAMRDLCADKVRQLLYVLKRISPSVLHETVLVRRQLRRFMGKQSSRKGQYHSEGNRQRVHWSASTNHRGSGSRNRIIFKIESHSHGNLDCGWITAHWITNGQGRLSTRGSWFFPRCPKARHLGHLAATTKVRVSEMTIAPKRQERKTRG